MSVFEEIEQLLVAASCEFKVTSHERVYTSQEAANIRGVPLSSGAKALICKCDGSMVMFVLPADRRLNSKRIRNELGCRKLRFASRDEVERITNLSPGAIPPFGSLFQLPTFCDEALSKNEHINFNAGDHAISVSMRYADYVRVERPTVGNFGE